MLHVKVTKHLQNPIFTPLSDENSFERAAVFNPAAVVKDNKVCLIYRGEDDYYKKYISRLGLAVSEDGFNFERFEGNPIIEENPSDPFETQGCEDPRLIKIDENNNYFLTYVGYGGGVGSEKKISLRGAFSTDLKSFEKIGEIIPGNQKSGAIIQDYKYHNQYVMYFGDKNLNIAFSPDLIHWQIHEKPILTPRENMFDSLLIEGGPPPIVTDDAILVIYNSAKAGKKYKNEATWMSYSPGYALFDKNDPTRLLFRSDDPILEPTEYWEKYGKVNYVIFVTCLVKFKNKWLLYYGGADKSIGVAELKFY